MTKLEKPLIPTNLDSLTKMLNSDFPEIPSKMQGGYRGGELVAIYAKADGGRSQLEDKKDEVRN